LTSRSPTSWWWVYGKSKKPTLGFLFSCWDFNVLS
jgi:hypothetical protein